MRWWWWRVIDSTLNRVEEWYGSNWLDPPDNFRCLAFLWAPPVCRHFFILPPTSCNGLKVVTYLHVHVHVCAAYLCVHGYTLTLHWGLCSSHRNGEMEHWYSFPFSAAILCLRVAAQHRLQNNTGWMWGSSVLMSTEKVDQRQSLLLLSHGWVGAVVLLLAFCSLPPHILQCLLSSFVWNILVSANSFSIYVLLVMILRMLEHNYNDFWWI